MFESKLNSYTYLLLFHRTLTSSLSPTFHDAKNCIPCRIKPDPYPEGAHVKPADLLKLNGKRKGKKAKSPDLNDKDSKEPVDIKSEQLFKEPSGVPVVLKRPSDSSSGDGTDTGIKKKARLSPPPIECPEPNCGKRYSHKNGLKYHQAHAHQNKSDAEETKPVVCFTGSFSGKKLKGNEG